MNTKTKLTALLMSILMIVAMIPAFALTVSADGAAEQDDAHVASVTIGNSTAYYKTFNAAFTAANAAGTSKIQLLKNCTITACVDLVTGLNLTLDLNGCVLKADFDSAATDSMFDIPANAVLNVEDTNPTVSHKYDTTNDLYVWNDGGNGKELPGGAITGFSTSANGGLFFGETDATLNISDGNFVGNTTSNYGAIASGQACFINISGGIFVGNTAGKGAQYALFTNISNTPPKIKLSGGVFSPRANGNYYGLKQDNLFNAGYAFESDSATGGYKVVFKYPFCNTTTGNAYETFKEAQNVGATNIQLMGNVATSAWYANVNDSKTYTFDLNGYVISAGTHFDIGGNATLTIKDSRPDAEHWYDATAEKYVWIPDGTVEDYKANHPDAKVIKICGGAMTGGEQTNYSSCVNFKSSTATAIIEGGNFVGNSGQMSGAIGANSGASGTHNVTIKGGLFVGNTCSQTTGAANVWIKQSGTVSITGGRFYAEAAGGGFKADYVDTANYNQLTLTNDSQYHNMSDGVEVLAKIKFMGVQQSSTDKGSLRLIAMVDVTLMNGATGAGFDATMDQKEDQDWKSNYYYTTLLAQNEGEKGQTKIEPAYEGYVMIAVVVNGVPTTGTVEFTVTPYVTVTEKQTGAPITIIVTEGVISFGK